MHLYPNSSLFAGIPEWKLTSGSGSKEDDQEQSAIDADLAGERTDLQLEFTVRSLMRADSNYPLATFS